MTGAPDLGKIALVEDHGLFAEALTLLLSLEGYDVVQILPPTGPDAAGTLLASILQVSPWLVLLDLGLGPYLDGTELVEPLVQSGAAVMVVTGTGDRSEWGECLRLGAAKVMSKTAPFQDVLTSIRRIKAGLPVISDDERSELLELSRRRGHEVHQLRLRLAKLTRREAEVLTDLIHGLTVAEIARIGVLSEGTVRTQVKTILAKLEVSSQIAAVGLAHRAHWSPPSPPGHADHH